MLPARSDLPIQSAALQPGSRRTFAYGASRASPNLGTGLVFLVPSCASLEGGMRNAAAALVAIVCWAGLAVQFAASYSGIHDIGSTLWVLARFFTIITNLLVAIAMTAVAIGQKPSPGVLG